MNDGFLSINEFAEHLKVHPNTIRRAIKNGKIQAINMGTGKKKLYRIPESELGRLGLFELKEMLKRLPPDDEFLNES